MYPFSQFSRLQANLKSVRRRRLYVPTLWANEMAKEITPASREDRPTCHTCFFTQTGPEHSVPVQRWPLPPSQGCQAQWTDTCTPAHTDTGSESSLPCAQTADLAAHHSQESLPPPLCAIGPALQPPVPMAGPSPPCFKTLSLGIRVPSSPLDSHPPLPGDPPVSHLPPAAALGSLQRSGFS